MLFFFKMFLASRATTLLKTMFYGTSHLDELRSDFSKYVDFRVSKISTFLAIYPKLSSSATSHMAHFVALVMSNPMTPNFRANS